MIALLVVILAPLTAFFFGRRFLAAGLLVVIAYGYIFGIFRANFQSTFSFFLFDGALIGLYASQFVAGRTKRDATENRSLNMWVYILMGWPLLLLLMPFQTFLVSLVGLRGNMFMLPAVLLGTRLRDRDLRWLALGFSVLNLIALAFGVAEYFKGIEPFFPEGPLTGIIYNSLDSAGGHRIPSTFSNAHTYAGVMVFTLPMLFGAWALESEPRWRKIIYVLGMGAALMGVLLAATRLNIILAGILAVIASLSGKLGSFKRIIWAVGIAAIVWSAMHNERWQRYKELDSDTLQERVAGSVNRSFLEVLVEYPMGNGLGGGGTSIPYFLASQVNRPVWVENEYCRILLEEGVVGLLLWLGFVVFFIFNRRGFVKDQWFPGRRMAWYLCILNFGTGLIGVGMLTSVPGSLLFMLLLGWTSVTPETSEVVVPGRNRRQVSLPVPVGARLTFR